MRLLSDPETHPPTHIPAVTLRQPEANISGRKTPSSSLPDQIKGGILAEVGEIIFLKSLPNSELFTAPSIYGSLKLHPLQTTIPTEDPAEMSSSCPCNCLCTQINFSTAHFIMLFSE